MKEIFKECFNAVFKSAEKKANKDYDSFYNSKVFELTLLEKIKTFEDKLTKINNLIHLSPHPYYCHLIEDSELLFHQFYNRSLLLKVDESNDLKESSYLGFYRILLIETLTSLKESIPEFTFNMYLEGKECQFLNSSRMWHNVSEKDYLKIKGYRIGTLRNIIEITSSALIKGFRATLSNENDPIETIKNELLIIETELFQDRSETHSIKNILSKLTVFRNQSLNNISEFKLKKSYEVFHGKTPFSELSQTFFNDFILNIQKTNAIPLKPQTMFFVLNRIMIWLKSITKGASIKDPFILNESFEDYTTDIINNAFDEANDIVLHIKNNSPENQADKFIYYKNYFEKYRKKYNEFEEGDWFCAVDKPNVFISFYFEKTISKNYNLDNSNLIKDAIIIQILLTFLFKSQAEIYGEQNMFFQRVLDNCISLIETMDNLVFNKKIFLKKNYLETNLAFCAQKKHLFPEFHIINFASNLIEIFELIIQNFSNIFDELKTSEKGFYVFEKIKELKRSNLNINSFDSSIVNDDRTTNYKDLIIDFFEIEAQYIRDINASIHNPFPSTINTTENNQPKTKSFTYKNYNTQLSQLTDLMKYLINNSFICEHTNIVDFRKVFNHKIIETPIVWKGHISDLYYFINMLHNIEKKVNNLKQKQWATAIDCFVDENNFPFDRLRLRSQKKPLKNYKLIEKAVKLI